MSDALIRTASQTEFDRLTPPPGTFEIDPVHTFITFRAQHLVVGRVRGSFQSFAGTITVDDDLLRSRMEVSIDAASMATHMPIRDGDLRSSNSSMSSVILS